jgi:transcription antitermination factor NusG
MSKVERQGALPCVSGSDLGSPAFIQLVPNWFAVHTSSRHEKRVEQHFCQRSITHYLPLYRSPRKWRNGLKVVLDLPLFPGYIFVRIKRDERARVLEVPGVLAIVGGTAGEMAPLAEAEVDALRAGLRLRQAEPHPLLTVGQRVCIRSGTLAGLEGIVVRKKNSLRIVLTVKLIMQSIAVEVEEGELEAVDSEGFNGFIEAGHSPEVAFLKSGIPAARSSIVQNTPTSRRGCLHQVRDHGPRCE